MMKGEPGVFTAGRYLLIALLGALFLSGPVHAGTAEVTIEAPQTAKKGGQVLIRVLVRHEANNFFHYTDRVTITVNGETLQTWEFSAVRRPESGHFTRELIYTVTGPTLIGASAHCNLHGSAGERSLSIAIN